MIKTSIRLQDLRRKIYRKAKIDKSWRFWGLYHHVCKPETLNTAYEMARKNKGAPGIDGVTFEAIEESGVEQFLGEVRKELVSGSYRPLKNRRKAIPKGDGKERVLGIPSIRDRVVQGALKLILEPIFEADFQSGSYGYRPKRMAHQAVNRVAIAIAQGKTQVIDADLKSYFDTVQHDLALRKVSERVDDDQVMHLLKLIFKTSGKRGVPQGGVISPLISNLYLNEVDKMLERAKEVTRKGKYTHIEYARFADDLVILVDGHHRWNGLARKVYQRLGEELAKLKVQLNLEKTRVVDLTRGEDFTFLGFNIRQRMTLQGKQGVLCIPRMKARTSLLGRLKEVFKHLRSQPTEWVVNTINPILRGWVSYFRIGNSSRSFNFVRNWVERKMRRHLMRARVRRGFGWNRWSRDWLYKSLGLFGDYRVVYYQPKSTTSR
ncbi:RNA-directed DNA polymerase (Reverse transcriptase) [Magnetococcus marinus MC-1]|uniref:RNA-directed DNA polymerase (Reverse transcriptase) n=1 Tax=Magnetococcus marinus (strain ATCC BAA-1437 / JCM 17883 / MC-1) TaxID=156889 RepID=A0L945_MAGMM|nr:group II intron reverse transcriptase/maturase [Magnetococcus marinus]ABK44488.1 RNA-directed DNA polymerase (Reverse transcriptase) [Magnetococcus marinus MC-1]